MVGFTKLHGAIIHSSIWSEPMHVRIVWITMLSMANADGMVEASVSGLARAANVSRDECAEALAVLAAPDPESRDGTTGERIEQQPGGFFILNYANYRDRQTEQQVQAAERAKTYRNKKRASQTSRDVTPRHAASRPITPNATEAEAEAEADKNKSAGKPRARAVARPGSVPEETWKDWLAVRKAKRAGPVTQTVLDRMESEASKAKLSLADAVTESAARGWQAFKADWMKSGFQKPEGKSHHVPQVQHNSDLDLGDPGCDCLSCKAMRRDRRAS